MIPTHWCFALSLFGLYCSVNSDIRRPPKIIKEPKREEHFRQNAKITLECKAEGIPKVTYEWKKNGRAFSLNQRNIDRLEDGSIKIKNAKKSDEGIYQCIARNQYGTATSVKSILRMCFLNTNPPSSTTVVTVEEGKPFTLEPTNVNSFPQPGFNWEIATDIRDPNPTKFVLSKTKQVDEKGNLHFSFASPDDELGGRIYKCVAFNAVTDERKESNYYTVNVTRGNKANALPQLAFSTNEGRNETAIALIGKPFTLRCFFNGYPETNVLWELPRGQTLVGRFSTDNFNTELKISAITAADEGNYTCIGNNSVGQTRHTISVRVEAEPKFNRESDAPHDINITEGDTVTMNCNAEAIPEAEVTWVRDGQSLDKRNPPGRLSFSNGGKSLTIRDTCRDCSDPNSPTDLSVIQCNASNEHGYAVSSGYVNVLKKTEVTVFNVSEQLYAWIELDNENVFEYRCDVQSDPSTVVQSKWYKHHGKDYKIRLPSTQELPNATVSNGSLTIYFVANEDDSANWMKYIGVYTCEGYNGYSMSSKSVFILTTVRLTGSSPCDTWINVLFTASLTLLVSVLVFVFFQCYCKSRSKESGRKPAANENSVEPQRESDFCDGYETIPYDTLSFIKVPDQGNVPVQLTETLENFHSSNASNSIHRTTIVGNPCDMAHDDSLPTAECVEPKSPTTSSTKTHVYENALELDEYTGCVKRENVYRDLYTDLQHMEIE